MLRYSLVLALGLAFTGTASASNWADSMFDELSRDFGSVPRGPTLTHPFRLVNKTNATVHISSVRVSCGCTSAQAIQTTLAPGQETAILIQMDTRRFIGSKNVTIYVQFDQPKFDEVRLWVQANSRDDVSIAPEALAFGKIKRGNGGHDHGYGFVSRQSKLADYRHHQRKQLCADQLRAGAPREGGEVAYKLIATMRADAPAGKWFTDVWLQTNNNGSPKIRVPLTVEIEAPLTVSPPTVGLGQVKAGKIAERKVIVRGVQPFRIVSVEGADKELTVQDSTNDSKTVHVLTVTLQPQTVGELLRTLRVVTDLKSDETIEFNASAQIVP